MSKCNFPKSKRKNSNKDRNRAKKKMQLINPKNKKEIFWNIINALLAGIIFFLGALSTGNISRESVIFAVIISLSVAVNQFKDYWAKEKKEYKSAKLFSFIKL